VVGTLGEGKGEDRSWYSFSNEAVPRLVPVNGEIREAIPGCPRGMLVRVRSSPSQGSRSVTLIRDQLLCGLTGESYRIVGDRDELRDVRLSEQVFSIESHRIVPGKGAYVLHRAGTYIQFVGTSAAFSYYRRVDSK
jgi:hypothetical protein